MMHTLFTRLLERDFMYFNEQAFIIKACPDGEGRWSSQIPQDLVKEIRYKGAFNDNFVKSVIEQIENCRQIKSLLFVDCGGLMDEYNRNILQHCTHVIVLGSSQDDIEEWKTNYPNTKVLAEVKSVLNQKGNTRQVFSHIIDREKEKFNMVIADLDRGNQDVEIPSKFIDFFIRK